MATVFFPDKVLFDDTAGTGEWLMSHYREHLRFAQILAGLSTPYYVPDYNLAAWSSDENAVTAWLEAHQQIHDSLRQATGVGGIDLSEVNLQDEAQFYVWQDDHASEHDQLRSALGAT